MIRQPKHVRVFAEHDKDSFDFQECLTLSARMGEKKNKKNNLFGIQIYPPLYAQSVCNRY